jgi:predicted nucleic acid-binding protein
MIGIEFFFGGILCLELLPRPRNNTDKKEKEIEKKFYDEYYSSAYFINISDKIVEEAIEFSSKYNISSFDALHLSSAYSAEIDEFITSENPLKPMFLLNRIKKMKIISL